MANFTVHLSLLYSIVVCDHSVTISNRIFEVIFYSATKAMATFVKLDAITTRYCGPIQHNWASGWIGCKCAVFTIRPDCKTFYWSFRIDASIQYRKHLQHIRFLMHNWYMIPQWARPAVNHPISWEQMLHFTVPWGIYIMTIVILHLCIRFRSSMGALCLNSFPSLPSLEIFLCLVSSAKYTLSGLQLKCTACYSEFFFITLQKSIK